MRFHEIIKEGYKEVKVKFSNDANSEEINNYFDKFRDLVNKNQVSGNEKNIDWWGKQGWEQFKKFVDNKSDKKTKTQLKRSKIQGDFHVIKDDEDWLIIVPLNKDASCYFGKNTRWCVTKRSESHFEEYFYESYIALIYFIKKKTNQKWAMADYLRKDKAEYFDVEDTQIAEDEFLEQTGIESSLLDQIDEDVRFGELNDKIIDSIEYYDRKVYELSYEIKNLDYNELSGEIEERIIELGNQGLLEKYLGKFDEPVVFTPEFQKYILRVSYSYIRYIANPSLEIQMKAIEDTYKNMQFITRPHPKIQEYYVEYADDRFDGNFENNLKYKITDENAQILLMERYPHHIGLLRYASEKVKIAAVSTSGGVIRDIKNPSKDVQMAAIKEDPWAIAYIENIYPDVLIAAIKDEPRSISGLKNPSKEIQKLAIDINPFVLGRIQNVDPEIKKYAEEKIKS
jgi:hypothetical protein